MSLPVLYLVDDAARKIGDPNKTRVLLADWLVFYNESTRELCEKANVLKYRSTFDLSPTQAFAYPEEATVVSYVEATETPSDQDSWAEVKEAFEDEFRAETSGRYPDTTIPERYFADTNWFYLLPRPTAQIVGGGRITYYGLPDRIFDIPSAQYQLPAFTQDYVIRRMLVYAMEARHRQAEASKALERWYVDLEGLGDKMEDRSDDRRAAIRPPRNPFAGMR